MTKSEMNDSFNNEHSVNGFAVRHYRELDSTNSEAMRLAQSGAEDRLWVVSDVQTSGKGRQGKNWVSCEGNLHASLYLRLECEPLIAAQLSFVAGLSCFEAIQTLLPEEECNELLLKWPNDILLRGHKLSGILLESSKLPDNSLAVIIGIGVNVCWSPSIDAYSTTSLRKYNTSAIAKEIFEKVAKSTQKWLSIWDHGNGFNLICDKWSIYSHRIGDKIDVKQPKSVISGTYHGLADDGSLLIRLPSGQIRSVSVGDVSIIN